jgi:hypothetical protein
MPEIRCPMCAHMNPEGSLHCEKCDARLVPMGEIGKSLNLPTDSQPEEDDLSAFLEKIVDEGGQEATIEDGIDEEVLSWLDDEHLEQIDEDLPESVPEAEEEEEPDFRSLVEEEIDEKAITNWLSKASDEEGETEEKPDWMTLVVSEPDEDLSEVESWFDQPDEASAEEVEDQKETAKEDLFTAPLPDWLDEQPDKLAFEDMEAVDFTAQLPDWMEATGGEADEPFEADEEVEEEETQADEAEEPQFTAQLPDWMTEVEDSAEVSEPEELAEEEELPDWFTQELDEETLEQLEPPSTKSVPEDAGSKQLPIPKVSTGALPWMAEEPLDEESAEEETRQEEFELPTASIEPGQVEKPPRVQTGALPWVSNAREEDEWVASDEGEEESEETFTPEAESREPDFEEAPAEEPIVELSVPEDESTEPDIEEVPAEERIFEPSTSMDADEDFAMPLDEFIVDDAAEADEPLSSDEEEIESMSLEDVMAEEESFFTDEYLSIEPEESAPADEAIEVEGAADVSKSWSKFLETADKLGAEEELPEWFAKTGGGKPNQPVEPEHEESVEAEEPGDILSEEPEIEEPAKPEPPAKKRQSTWTLIFGRGKKKEEQQRLEAAETPSEPVAEPEPEAEPEIIEPEPTAIEDEADSEQLQAGEWDLSTILSDSQPLTTEPDDEKMAEEIKGDLTDSAWLVDESGKPLVEDIDEDQAEGDAEEIEPEAKPVLKMPQEEKQKKAEAPADGMSSLDRLTAALGLDEEEDIEELSDEDLIGFAGTTELPAWMMGDVDQEAEATAMLDAALGETEMQPEAMTAGLPDWLEEDDDDREEEEAILLPEPEDEAIFEETGEVDEVEEPEEVVSTAELPDWMEDEETEEEDDLITSVSGELADSQYTDWLAEFEVEDEPEETTGETDKAETEEGTAVLPDWLLESDQEPETSDDEIEDLFPATTALAGSTAGLPDWLSTYADDEEEDEKIADVTSIEIIKEPEELDDWLTESEDEDQVEQPLVVSDTDELNEWVQEHGIQFPTMDEDEEPSDDEVIPVDVRKDIPDWVFELEPEEEGEPIPELNGAGTAELPAWLVAGDESPDVAASDLEEQADEDFDFLTLDDSIAATTVFTLDDELDDEFVEEDDDDQRSLIISESTHAPTVELDSQSEWLSSYGEEESSPETSLDDEEVHEVEEIPEWVQLADTTGEWEEGVETFGAALKFDTFEEETIKEIPNEERNIQLMERILLSEKKAVPVPRTRQRNRQLTLRLTITLLMIALVALGLYYLPIPLPNFIANAPLQVVQFHQQMQYFQQTVPDKPVLMVFDLQPAYEGELSVYAELPLKALMENDTRIFTFSTVPEGAALAQKMMVDVVMENNLVYNTQSQAMNLGYLPGGAAAIRDFALNMRFTVHGLDVGVNGAYIWEHPDTLDVDSLDDFAMVIVMTDDLDKARLWIEQSSLYLPASTPLLMVSSAKVTPLLKPYLLSGQLGGLIGNPIDAAAYATLSNESSQVIYFWKAYELGIYLMMASVFGGAVYLIVNQMRKEKNGTMRGGK